jgi:hypothetical protein
MERTTGSALDLPQKCCATGYLVVMGKFPVQHTLRSGKGRSVPASLDVPERWESCPAHNLG